MQLKRSIMIWLSCSGGMAENSALGYVHGYSA
jgi:hypothetical protein